MAEKIIIGLSEEDGKKLLPLTITGGYEAVEIVFDDKNYGVIIIDTWGENAKDENSQA